MRELTFSGFLRSYLNDLSNENSENLSRLAEKADAENPRLKEPLLLYAYFTKEPKTVKRQFANSSLYKEYCVFLEIFPNKEATIEYLKGDSSFNNYRKVYKSYLSKRDRYKAENELKENIRCEILSLLKSKGIAAYSLLKNESLGLNKGNFYAFLRGKTDCITLSTAYKVFKCLKTFEN